MTEEASFFNDLADVELGVKDGKYPAYIRKSEIVTKKDGSKAWVLTYQISDGKQKGEQVQEWHNSWPNDPEKNANAKKWRARRLESLGVPESQWTSFSPDQVVGTFVIIGVKTNNGYTNVSSVELADERTGLPLRSTSGTPSATASASAAPTPQGSSVAQPQAAVTELM